MKKLFFLLLVIIFAGLFTLPAIAGNGDGVFNAPPTIKHFHAIFGPGYVTGVARIYDADNNLTSFEFGAIYGIKFNGEKMNIGEGCGYTCGLELRPQGNGFYVFSAMLPSQKITNEFIYIVIMGKARDADGNTTIKKIRALPAEIIGWEHKIFKKKLPYQKPKTRPPISTNK